MELDTVAKILAALYRLTGTEADDPALAQHGEAPDEVAYLYLTSGCREAQRWMLDQGYDGWSKRTSVITWTGTDEVDGGKYFDLPSDILRIRGDEDDSALREPNGQRWGREVEPDKDHILGNFFYLKGERLWRTRSAEPPATLFLDYHYTHPFWDSMTTIEFPIDARWLIVAEAALEAKDEFWLPGDQFMERRIESRQRRARQQARVIVRRSKKPRKMRKARRMGNRW